MQAFLMYSALHYTFVERGPFPGPQCPCLQDPDKLEGLGGHLERIPDSPRSPVSPALSPLSQASLRTPRFDLHLDSILNRKKI